MPGSSSSSSPSVTALDQIVIGVPAAYLVAIFRHGLWNLDVVVKKTVQYATVLAAFAVIAGITLIAIPVLFAGIDADLLPAVVIGLVLAAAFAFVRPRAQRLADRLVYGRRSTPYEVLSAFAERLGETFSTEDVLPRMAQLLAAATGARVAAVWLRIGDQLRREAVWPEGAGGVDLLPMRGADLPDLGGRRDVRGPSPG